MIPRPQFGVLLAMCCVLAGCAPQPPVTRADLVGTYVYKSEDPEGKPTDHEWDRLIIEADGKYDLVQGGPTKPKTETAGVWILYAWSPSAHGPEVVLDHAGYPIEIKRKTVRLLIDNDVGIWYEKVK